MQFHLNGFKPGNPELSEAAERGTEPPDALPDEVDVLIVGCGPAGLTLAAQLAAFPEVKTRIVEQKSGPLQLGQADGIACRTMEMFEAFGFSERVLKEAYWVNETSFWKADVRRLAPDRFDHLADGLVHIDRIVVSGGSLIRSTDPLNDRACPRAVPGDGGRFPDFVEICRLSAEQPEEATRYQRRRLPTALMATAPTIMRPVVRSLKNGLTLRMLKALPINESRSTPATDRHTAP